MVFIVPLYPSIKKFLTRSSLSVALITVVAAVGMGISPLKRQLTNTALVEAVRRRDAVAVKAALRRGADPNALDAEGEPVLHWSVIFGDFETTQLLLQGGLGSTRLVAGGRCP